MPLIFTPAAVEVAARASPAFAFPNSNLILTFQEDGNFVLYQQPGKNPIAATASNSTGRRPFTLRFQTDGNLVVYEGGGSKALWASDTGGVAAGADFVIRDERPYMQIVGKDGRVFYTANER